MAASLIARDLTVTRGELTVLSHVDLSITPGHRMGVVGPNGIGKSTLLQALAGVLSDPTTAVEGLVERAPRTATVGYLPQEPDRSSTETVDEFLARRTGVAAAQRDLEASTAAMANGAQGADDRYGDALDTWLRIGAADFDARAGEVFADLSLSERLRNQPTASLSGGEAARASLASLLLAQFDVFLLDEPTNDLDLAGLDRLERWVVGVDAPVALVSHDRSFLERTVTDVVEIDHYSREVTHFLGGWAAFLRERELAGERAQRRYDEYAGKRQSLVDRGQREREWATRGAGRARRSDESDKHIRHHQLNQTEQLAGRAARTDKAIERLEVVDEPRRRWELRYEIPTVGRSGDVVWSAHDVVVERGSFALGPINLDISFADRIVILGANGSGKTTLLDLVLGRLEPTGGRMTPGASIVLGEVGQTRLDIVGDGLVESVCAATKLTVEEARTLLAKFGFGPEHLGRAGATLSPGERTRAALAVLMANGANLLVVDEPTNHLDLDAIEQLESALNAFDGTVLLVTHDRSLLRKVRFDRAVLVEHGNVVEIPVEDARSGIDAGPSEHHAK